MSNIQPEITRHASKPLKMTHNQEKQSPNRNNPRNLKNDRSRRKIVNIVTIIFRYLKENMNNGEKNKRYEKYQMELVKVKNTISEATNIPDGIFNRLDTVGKKLLNLWT